jgi:hypothetical protein
MLTGMPTEAQFSKFGGQLAWKADFDNINQPKYTSQDCNQDFVIRIITLLVSLLNLRINLEPIIYIILRIWDMKALSPLFHMIHR